MKYVTYTHTILGNKCNPYSESFMLYGQLEYISDKTYLGIIVQHYELLKVTSMFKKNYNR